MPINGNRSWTHADYENDQDIFFPKNVVGRGFAAMGIANVRMAMAEFALRTRGLSLGFAAGAPLIAVAEQLKNLRCAHTAAIATIFFGQQRRVCLIEGEREGRRTIPCPDQNQG